MLPRRSVATGTARPPIVMHTLDDVVEAFWLHHRCFGEPSRSDVARLAKAALSEDASDANKATSLLFRRVIEPLCDSFSEADAKTYRRAFAQILMIARAGKRCEALNRELAADGILSEGELLERVPENPAWALDAAERSRIRSVFVLSRLTLGADVAITSIILHRAREAFPHARIHLVGTTASKVVAESVAEVSLVEVPYRRSDALAERLNAWPHLRRQLLGACARVRPENVVVLDPDSRLTQLGLLPPLPTAKICHFPSRSYAADDPGPLSKLVGRWLDETFGIGPSLTPRLRLGPRDTKWSQSLRAGIGGDAPLVCVSFGVGGNERKRAGMSFETDLVEWIVRQGCKVLLSRGVGDDEVEQSLCVTRLLHARGMPALHLPEGRALPAPGECDSHHVVTFQADVGAFLAAIACADIYVGYDSAGQHIAAALGVPTLSLFIESAGRRHAERWTPRGPAQVSVVRAPPPVATPALFDAARQGFRLLRSHAGSV